MIFNDSTCSFSFNWKTLTTFSLQRSLYVLPTVSLSSCSPDTANPDTASSYPSFSRFMALAPSHTPCTPLTTPSAPAKGLRLWNERLADVDPSTIVSMVEQKFVAGVNLPSSLLVCTGCAGCQLAKGGQVSFHLVSSTPPSTKLLQLIQTDLAGAVNVPSLAGVQCFFSFNDDTSRWVSVFMMVHKSDTVSKSVHFQRSAELHTGNCTQALRSDNGVEFVSTSFRAHLEAHRIHHQPKIKRTPLKKWGGGAVHRTSLDLVRCMLFHASVSERI